MSKKDGSFEHINVAIVVRMSAWVTLALDSTDDLSDREKLKSVLAEHVKDQIDIAGAKDLIDSMEIMEVRDSDDKTVVLKL